MKYKLIGVNTKRFINIGDYIQALASSQFLPKIDGFIQRERLKEYGGEDSAVIMNGWYMHSPMHWPPSNNIKPLFVAFHLNRTVTEQLLSEASIRYLKNYEPIGCRDLYTVGLLKSKGIDAYFSGCMTLTLGKKYRNSNKDGKIYFVDPYVYVSRNILYYITRVPFFLRNIKSIITISKKWYNSSYSFRGLIKSTLFWETYSPLFDTELLLNSEYRIQAGTKNWPKTDKELLDLAETLIKDYAKASFVVTSRIHCGLPCLGLETPVIFTTAEKIGKDSACRLGGLKELFNTLEWQKNRLIPNFKLNDKISRNNFPNNNNSWKKLAQSLSKRCSEFISSFQEVKSTIQ